jgi:hypothetical protein
VAAEQRGARVADAIFGVFFVALALAILLAAWESAPIGAACAALVVGGLGADAILSTARGKRSLASHIGPLP